MPCPYGILPCVACETWFIWYNLRLLHHVNWCTDNAPHVNTAPEWRPMPWISCQEGNEFWICPAHLLTDPYLFTCTLIFLLITYRFFPPLTVISSDLSIYMWVTTCALRSLHSLHSHIPGENLSICNYHLLVDCIHYDTESVHYVVYSRHAHCCIKTVWM